MRIGGRQERRVLRRAARLWGLQTDYTDAFKDPVRSSDDVLLQILSIVSETEIHNLRDLEKLSERAHREKVSRGLAPVYAFRDGQPKRLRFFLTGSPKSLTWKILLENGERLSEKAIPRKIRGLYHEAELKSELPVGYHHLSLVDGDKEISKSFLLCAPELKIKSSSAKKAWGVFAPIYGLRSERDWGMGDLQEMEEFQQAIHGFGASFLGTLPILPAVNEGPEADPSPYSPVSRLFWNEIFLNVDDLARESEAAKILMQADAFKKEKERLRKKPLVDYQGVMALKKPILRLLAREFFASGRDRADGYRDFLKRSPEVEKYARFRAGQDETEFHYHLYAQFQMDLGLRHLSERAKTGRAAGLYLDFPVGASRGGFDSHAFAGSFLNEVNAGAPPDTIFVGGQNWGFAPLHPRNVREEGYAYFAQCMRHHMRYAKILRLDHVMAFKRIYCVPQGVDAKSGAYIRYQADEFFAVLAIEAARSGVEIVGEDLGTVPESMRKSLNENNCLGMWVLPFEVTKSPTKAAANARPKTLACLNTHDMVPWEGYIRGHDIELLEELKVIDHDLAEKSRAEREKTLRLWQQDVGVSDKDELFPKLTELMARGPSEFLLINMEDLWREAEAQNVPGTWREHPNWQRKLKKTTTEWLRDAAVTSLLQKTEEWRRMKTLPPPAPPLLPQKKDEVSFLLPEDLYLFNEGRHHRAYLRLGAHPGEVSGTSGVWFSVWAPAAQSVSVIGEFNDWRPERDFLKSQGESGVWSGFIAGVKNGQTYKYHIKSGAGFTLDKADPFAFAAEIPPRTASRVQDLDYRWNDDAWMKNRGKIQARDQAMSTYEMHLGSWKRKDGDQRSLTYLELAAELPKYLREMGFTHVEFMPVMEHPFYGSWGYQSTGYFAPTSRYGSPQDFMFLVDALHQAEIGVILDWVPSHFPEDAYALSQFNGTHLFEHEDPRLGFHPDWKSLIFNYGRHEVRSFLISSAIFWLDKYHIDGIRVDAVASMLYLDYSRKEGEWLPNPQGGRENLEAIHFLQELNKAVYRDFPDVHMIAEESTAWPKVSAPVDAGGLGFGMKWDMGWMHDTLEYFKKDPIYRRYHQGQLPFRMVYAFNENFVLSISHDEVVYGKGSLFQKMSGDEWQKFANLRTFYSYMFALPGKKLIFMGSEFAQRGEWHHESQLEWGQTRQQDQGGAIQDLLKNLNRLYRTEKALHEFDFSPQGFEWLDASDEANCVFSFFRKSQSGEKILCIFNMVPVVRTHYRLGVDEAGSWREVLNSDAKEFGGSGVGNMGKVKTHPVPSHGRLNSLTLTLPPLAALYLKYEGDA